MSLSLPPQLYMHSGTLPKLDYTWKRKEKWFSHLVVCLISSSVLICFSTSSNKPTNNKLPALLGVFCVLCSINSNFCLVLLISFSYCFSLPLWLTHCTKHTPPPRPSLSRFEDLKNLFSHDPKKASFSILLNLVFVFCSLLPTYSLWDLTKELTGNYISHMRLANMQIFPST